VLVPWAAAAALVAVEGVAVAASVADSASVVPAPGEELVRVALAVDFKTSQHRP
jgi:hypothetical protein